MCRVLLVLLAIFGVLYSQNVGIGTATPSSRLSVLGNLSIGSSTYTNTSAPLNGAIIEGTVGIGTNTPGNDVKLHVQGPVRIADGTEGDYKILTSDATGKASWKLPPSSVTAYDGETPALYTNTNTNSFDTLYSQDVNLIKGVYLVFFYNCFCSTTADYYLVADWIPISGTVDGGKFVWRFDQNKLYTSIPFVLKVISPTATVRFRAYHATGGKISDCHWPLSTTCTRFQFFRIAD